MDCEACRAELKAVRERMTELSESTSESFRDIWVAINKLKDNHNGHDKTILLLTQSIEFMSKELTKSITALSEALSGHLKEEEQERKDTIKELKSLGWKVMTAIVLTGIAATFGIKFIGG